jgi:putative oxidoreductase
MPTIARFVNRLSRLLQPVAAVVTRVVLGHAFLLTGIGKWRFFDNTVDFFTRIGIPAPKANAAFVATLEVVGGACLVLGFGTRIFALLLSATLAVAILTADRQSVLDALAWSPKEGLLDLAAPTYLMFLFWLAAYGAGPASVDRLLAKKGETAV